MSRSLRPRLYDIDLNIDLVLLRAAGKGIADLRDNVEFRYFVLHAVMIIAEAASKIPQAVTAEYPEIPWGDIVGMGTKIKHAYHRVDLDVLWDTVTVHFPLLRPVIKRMLVAAEETRAPV